MATKLKPYPEYREVDLPWARRLPAHWDIERAKWLFTKMDRPVKPEHETITCFRDGTVTLRKNRRTTGFTESLNETGYQGIREGDLVIHAMDAFAGAVGVSDADGKGTPVYAVCQPHKGADPQYYARVVREMARNQYIAALATGIRQRSTDFRYSTFANEFVPVPPPEEQIAISRYLMAAERRITRLIQMKQRLIKLLNEQKQATILRAVTRGLDPNVPLKHSGVKWLGEIPAHWAMVPNRAPLRLKKVPVGDRSSEYTLLSLTMQGVIPRDLENAKGKFPASFDTYQVVEQGDLLLCLFDIDETPRTIGAVQQKGMVSGAYTAFACEDMTAKDYLYYLYLALDNQKALKAVYTGLRKVIPKSVFLGLKSPMPPKSERVEIIDFVRKRIAEHDSAIEKAKAEIALMREYRARLNSDIVTGKRDVRGVELQEMESDYAPADLDIPGDEEPLPSDQTLAYADD